MYSEVSVLSDPVIHPRRANRQVFGTRWAPQVQIGLWETGVYRLSRNGHTSGPYCRFSLEVRKNYFQGHKPSREGTFTRTWCANEKREENVSLHHVFVANVCFVICARLILNLETWRLCYIHHKTYQIYLCYIYLYLKWTFTQIDLLKSK